MKKSILILALCFVLMFAVAAVSAQDANPAEEPVAEEIALENEVEETAEEALPEDEPVAEAPAGFKVTYLENDCLAEVPTDEKTYAAGDEVTCLFEPVAYKDYLIFYGWDIDDDGIADYGYYYDKFNMPEEDVELKAICIGAYGGGGNTCKGCHLHGKPGSTSMSFTGDFVPYGPTPSDDPVEPDEPVEP